MIDLVLMSCAAAVAAAFVCRVDRLSWRWHPGQMVLHVLGGIAAVWVMTAAGEGRAQAWHALALVCAALLLAAPRWRHGPPAGTIRSDR